MEKIGKNSVFLKKDPPVHEGQQLDMWETSWLVFQCRAWGWALRPVFRTPCRGALPSTTSPVPATL